MLTNNSIYIIVECSLPHTHCTLAAGLSARYLVFSCLALCKDKLWLYAEFGSFTISIYIRKILIKYWLKIMNSGYHSLPGIVYYNMFNSSEQSWATKIKHIFF